MVKELVTLHQGKITVASETNKGFVFSCHFPLNKKMVTDIKMTASSFQQSHLEWREADELYPIEEKQHLSDNERPIILIVEDHEDVRNYIMEKLGDRYSLLQAKNGKEGWQLTIAQIPDLVISDVMMPEMDGIKCVSC